MTAPMHRTRQLFSRTAREKSEAVGFSSDKTKKGCRMSARKTQHGGERMKRVKGYG
jgi:hypothetical protein